MNNCIFCQIASRKVPSEILYENEHVISILDINPIHFGHALVFPKKHCRDFLDLPAGTYKHVLQAANIVTKALVENLNLDGYNLFSNNGSIAGQSVFHFHLHITPRYADDNIRFVLRLKEYPDGEMKRYGEILRNSINKQPEMK